jgi:hypothetical protein
MMKASSSSDCCGSIRSFTGALKSLRIDGIGCSLMFSKTKVCSASVNLSTSEGASSSPVEALIKPTTTGMSKGSFDS